MRILFKDIIKEGITEYPFKSNKDISITNDDGKKIIIKCELAQTPEEKSQGLLYRDSLCDNCGVLFNSDRNGSYHMVDMKFPIEMIFINDGKIVGIIKAKPGEENITSTNEYSMNLEVNDGFTEKNIITVGNEIST